jgi:tRNA threonylcarbamoyladenosine biosynthesis protein TsaE
MAKNKKLSYITKSPDQTKELGAILAKTVLEGGPRRRAFVLALRGDLGAGKTQLVQGFAKGLGIKGTVNSPTFVIFKKYPIGEIGRGFKTFYHIDCYRLGAAEDLEVLGIADIFADPGNIVAIEWPDIAKANLRKNFLKIDLEVAGDDDRRVVVEF